MSYQTIQQIVNGLSLDKLAKVPFHKRIPTSVPTQYRPHSYWQGEGVPVVGTVPTNGKANGRVCTNSTDGAVLGIPANAYLASSSVGQQTSSSATGTLMLVDRISDINLNHNEATGSLTGLDATSRLATGAGAHIWIEAITTLGASSNTFTLTYTNQDGTGSRTTPNIVTIGSAIQGKSVLTNAAYTFAPLQDGDVGVRSIQSITLVSGSSTGTMLISLVRPLVTWLIPAIGYGSNREELFSATPLPAISSSACLSFLWFPFSAAGMGISAGCLNFITD